MSMPQSKLSRLLWRHPLYDRAPCAKPRARRTLSMARRLEMIALKAYVRTRKVVCDISRVLEGCSTCSTLAGGVSRLGEQMCGASMEKKQWKAQISSGAKYGCSEHFPKLADSDLKRRKKSRQRKPKICEMVRWQAGGARLTAGVLPRQGGTAAELGLCLCMRRWAGVVQRQRAPLQRNC